jgi:hypothetical protein
VNNYAWGEALLSFIYHGMRKFCNGMRGNTSGQKKKYFDGNVWVLLVSKYIKITFFVEFFFLFL